MSYQIYPWQEDCLHIWEEKNTRGCIRAATGSGKTILALFAVQKLRNSIPHPLKIRIVVPTVAIMRQWVRTIQAFFSEVAPKEYAPSDIGCRYGGYLCSEDCTFIVYVVNSARKMLAGQIQKELGLGYDVFLIADECHHFYSKENRKIFDFIPLPSSLLPHYHSLGLSATPNLPRGDSIVAAALGEEIYRYGFSRALSDQRISPYVILQTSMTFTASEQEIYMDYTGQMGKLMIALKSKYHYLETLHGNDLFLALRSLAGDNNEGDSLAATYLHLAYKRKELVCLAGSRIACLKKLLPHFDNTDRILIFCERILQADCVYNELVPLFGMQVGKYHSGRSADANRWDLNAFRDRDKRILICCRALDEGLDVPDANIGIVLSSTSVSRQHIQRLGRILRRAEGKHMAALYYFYLSDSAEESTYLPQESSARISNLDFSYADGTFSNNEYERTSLEVLVQLSKETQDRKLLREARRCLMDGLVLPDWLSTQECISIHQKEAKTTHEKNYWLCMQRMHNAIEHCQNKISSD